MDAETVELLIRTGPGTAMGSLMRRYWVPVLLAAEVAEPDGPPVRVKILGERLLAFRDTQGRPGLIDEFCAHRRARGVQAQQWAQQALNELEKPVYSV